MPPRWKSQEPPIGRPAPGWPRLRDEPGPPSPPSSTARAILGVLWSATAISNIVAGNLPVLWTVLLVGWLVVFLRWAHGRWRERSAFRSG